MSKRSRMDAGNSNANDEHDVEAESYLNKKNANKTNEQHTSKLKGHSSNSANIYGSVDGNEDEYYSSQAEHNFDAETDMQPEIGQNKTSDARKLKRQRTSASEDRVHTTSTAYSYGNSGKSNKTILISLDEATSSTSKNKTRSVKQNAESKERFRSGDADVVQKKPRVERTTPSDDGDDVSSRKYFDDFYSSSFDKEKDATGEVGMHNDDYPEGSGSSNGNMHVVAKHYNELKEAGRKERIKSRIFHMRNFNNWIKSQLINEYLGRIKDQLQYGDPICVLDMCCGKGGDLLKWEKANIRHLICTDIAEVSVEQCKRRYKDILHRANKSKYGCKFTAEFFACDSTLVRLRERYKDASLKLNLVSCQFSFHYSFESLSQADCMVRNAAECLQPGGYFIATIPDAYEIMRRLHNSDNGKSFGNDIYKIEFIGETDPPPLFGAKYQFHLEGVVDCPEFLVHFPTLVKLCRKHGLKLQRKTTFADYYNETLPTGKQLLQRMNGLETVYANRCGNDEQYAHVRNAIGIKGGRALGTLSKAEWEATTLYLVCAFVKCKNTWDSEGKPVFKFD